MFGVDGVGKSAVIDRLPQKLPAMFRGFRRFHFRPMFCRRVNRPPITDPHGKPARGVVISLAKLLCWLADCWFGYLMAIRPALRRSQLVVFDRYLPDILVDPLRYRLPPTTLRFAHWMIALAPHPDLYVLLDAPAEVVQRRKREVPDDECRRQRVTYLKMFAALDAKLLVNADCQVDEVAERVAFAIRIARPHQTEELPQAIPVTEP